MLEWNGERSKEDSRRGAWRDEWENILGSRIKTSFERNEGWHLDHGKIGIKLKKWKQQVTK